MYAKYISETGVLFPPYEKDGIINYNKDSNAEQLLKDGYKPLVEEECPSGLERPFLKYKEEEDKIIAYWVDYEEDEEIIAKEEEEEESLPQE